MYTECIQYGNSYKKIGCTISSGDGHGNRVYGYDRTYFRGDGDKLFIFDI